MLQMVGAFLQALQGRISALNARRFFISFLRNPGSVLVELSFLRDFGFLLLFPLNRHQVRLNLSKLTGFNRGIGRMHVLCSVLNEYSRDLDVRPVLRYGAHQISHGDHANIGAVLEMSRSERVSSNLVKNVPVAAPISE